MTCSPSSVCLLNIMVDGFNPSAITKALHNQDSPVFASTGIPDSRKIQKFLSYLDKFFDCLNGRHMKEGIYKRKPNLRPYRNADDKRLKV